MFEQPYRTEAGIDEELLALNKLEATSNAIRLRIAGLAPDQLYNGTAGEPTIAELIAAAVDRERAFGDALRRGNTETDPRLEEPALGPSVMDRDFARDLAAFFDLRRGTLDLVRSFGERAWKRKVTLPNAETITLERAAIRLQHHDTRMLKTISDQKRRLLRTNGIDELRDMGVAGKLGENLAQ